MVSDVIQELERYGRNAESVASPILLAEVTGGRRASSRHLQISPPLASRPRRGLVVALGAAALTLAVIGGVAVLDPFASDQPVVDSPPATTAPVEPDEPEVLPTPVEFLVWSSVLDPDFDVEGSIEGIAPTSIGWFGVGSAVNQSGELVPAVWMSIDGDEWVRIESEVFDNELGVIRDVADHTGRIVVAGIDTDAGVPAFWYSNDGFNWERLEAGDVFGPEGAEVHALVVHWPGISAYVAVGTHVWTSPNGLDWNRHDLPGGTAYSLMELDDGLLAGGVESTGKAAIWLSEDLGSTWSAVDVNSSPDLFPASVINSMTRTDDGYVAVGGVGAGDATQPAVWTSADGQQWDLTWAAGDGVRGTFRSVAYSAGQTVAVGESGTAGTVWLSADSGATWVEYGDRLGLFAAGNDPSGVSVDVIRSTDPVGFAGFAAAGERKGEPAIWFGAMPKSIPDVNFEGYPLVGWTCQARIDNDAIWGLGEWDDDAGHYVAAGTVPCLDLLEIHLEPQQWKVEWEGVANKLEIGFLLWFERGLHGTNYAARKIKSESGEWLTPILSPDPEEPFTWVAMGHSFDDWEEITWTVTPCAASDCG